MSRHLTAKAIGPGRARRPASIPVLKPADELNHNATQGEAEHDAAAKDARRVGESQGGCAQLLPQVLLGLGP
jgi:hypothetical protein